MEIKTKQRYDVVYKVGEFLGTHYYTGEQLREILREKRIQVISFTPI